MEVDIPEVHAELVAVFERYEEALIGNDIAALNEMFWASPLTLRYGTRVAEHQYGHAEIAAFRIQRGAINQDRALENSRVTTFGRDFGIANTEFRSPGSDKVGRQSQTWMRTDNGWKIVSAHVSFGVLGSDHLLQQPDDLALLLRFERHERFLRDPVSTFDRVVGDAMPDLGDGHHAAAAVVRVDLNGHQISHPQPVDHTLDGRSIEINQPAEMVLRAGADLHQLGQRGKLGLRQVVGHQRHEDRGVPLHRHAQQKADLIVHEIRGCFAFFGDLRTRLLSGFLCHHKIMRKSL